MNTHKTLIAAAVAVVTLVFSTAAALAVPAVATGAVNVRTGGGTSFAVVDQLYVGEPVEVVQCQGGWCYVQHDGPDGWVSGNYLSNAAPPPPPGPAPTPEDPNCGFGLTVGPGGPNFSINCGNGVAPPPVPVPVAQVCFYNGNNYTGASFCVAAGTSVNNLTGYWNNKISSFDIQGAATVTLCQNPGFGGFCASFNSDRAVLGAPLNNQASSYQVN